LTSAEPGRFQLPAVAVGWWNTDTDRWETARLPGRELIVLPTAEAPPETPPLFEPPDTPDGWSETDSTQPLNAGAMGTDQPRIRDEPEADQSGTTSGFWVWTTGLLGVVWLITVGLWWSNRRQRRNTLPPPLPAEPPGTSEALPPAPTDPLSQSIEAVRLAYESGEAGAAREALLAWAAIVLPEQPPGNLALLAKRCREPLREEILLLEQAFFSPRPVQWERRRVWERLSGFAPEPLEEPASFRRKKAIRRRKPSPDVAS
jgi:hypothetical protein